MITSQIIQSVIKAPIVVADLTGYNPNVFYEVAIRHFVRKPIIHLIERGDSIPFDVKDVRTVFVDTHDWDSPASAKDDVIKHMRFFQAHPDEVASPISTTLDVAKFLRSEQSVERQLAALTLAVETLSQQVTALTATRSHPIERLDVRLTPGAGSLVLTGAPPSVMERPLLDSGVIPTSLALGGVPRPAEGRSASAASAEGRRGRARRPGRG